jgi:hypothetical protein
MLRQAETDKWNQQSWTQLCGQFFKLYVDFSSSAQLRQSQDLNRAALKDCR